MAHYPLKTQTIDQMRRKLKSLTASMAELEQAIKIMEDNELSEIETTHVGQMDRAVSYALAYATGAKKSVLNKVHSADQ